MEKRQNEKNEENTDSNPDLNMRIPANGTDRGTKSPSPRREGVDKVLPGVEKHVTASLAFTILLFAPMVVLGDDPGNTTALNLTPQNERVACFGSSWVGYSFPTHLGQIIGREVEPFVYGGASSEDALSVCQIFEKPENKFGIIVTNFGNDVRTLSWEQIEKNLHELYQRLKDTGAIVVFDCYVSETYGFPYRELCKREGVILAQEINEGIGTPGNLDPLFFEGDASHPSEEGYCLFAERTARILLDNGLIQTAKTCEELPVQIPAVFSNATDLINEMKTKGADIQLAEKQYAIAQFIWDNWNHQYCYTVNWSLNERIIGPLGTCLESWGQITTLFNDANKSITTIEEQGKGKQALPMKADYSRAQNAWAEYDTETTKTYLEKVLTKAAEIQEPVSLTIFGLTFLGILSRSITENSIRPNHGELKEQRAG